MASVADDDPLLPWLRSIRQVKQTHAEDKSKILPDVSDCYKEFRDSVRYRNDPRFLRVCVQLADCSPDPIQIMGELDERGIGHNHALFYEAYATCLEAKRRFGDANNVYKRGLASQAQPAEKLSNSYKTFRDRMDTRKKRKQQDHNEQHGRKSCSITDKGLHMRSDLGDNGIRHMEACQGGVELASKSHLLATNLYTAEGSDISFEELRLANACKKISSNGEQQDANPLRPLTSQSVCISGKVASGSFGEETIQIRNFAAEVTTGKERDVEDARHHGLVDPTINTKEALQDILSMFCKPLDIAKKQDKRKPLKRLVSVSVAAAPPLLHESKRQMASPKDEKAFEFSVFIDDEQKHSQTKTSSKPSAIFPFLGDENKKTRSPLGSLQAQPLELCVFKDDELQIEPRSKLAEKGKDISVVAHSNKQASNPPWVSNSEQDLENSGFFVFMDDERSAGEEESALNVYKDKENIQCSKFKDSKKAKSEFLVFQDDSI